MFVNPDWVKALVETHRANTGTKGILAQEREKSNLGVIDLSRILYTKDGLDRRANILEILVSENIFDKSLNHSLDRRGKLALAIARGKRLRRLCVEHKWSEDDNQLALDLIGEPDPYGLHASLFLAALREQGTPKQHDRFLKKAEAYEYIGCYAQTELGHGSNVRGLETTATWIADKRYFILHSPSLTASKWWIGSLGKMATHAIVIAQLIIDSKSYGPHSFIVQVRNLETHEALPDIHIGDVGPKFGLNTMDNGFLLFNRLKIPHDNMLARHASVNPENNIYSRSPGSSSASLYATLTYVRCVIVQRAASALAKGVTVAVRYCAVRRQFQDLDASEPAGQETQVLNYTTVQYRLLPLLAATFALHFSGKKMLEIYEQHKKIKSGEILNEVQTSSNAEAMADLHATSCGLKALASTITADGLETARRACGGHGYSNFAAIGNMYTDYVPATIWEGDNYMIGQQVARYLLKSAHLVLKGELPQNATAKMLLYYDQNRQTTITFDVFQDDEQLVKAFGWRAAYLTFECLKALDEDKRT